MSKTSSDVGAAYELIEQIGEGKYGSVHLGRKKGNSLPFAIKSNQKSKYKKLIHDEYRIMKTIVSPYVVRVFDYWEIGDTAYYSMEYTPHGDLLKLMHKIEYASKSQSRMFMFQLTTGLLAIHKAGYVHCDIKLENILVFRDADNITLKITDFGFARLYSAEHYQLIYCGSCHYSSPEVIHKVPVVGPEIDVWSLGIVFYAIAVGKFPHSIQNADTSYVIIGGAINKMVLKGLPYLNTLDNTLSELLVSMLKFVPSERITISKISNSAWITNKVDVESHLRLNLEKVITPPEGPLRSPGTPIVRYIPDSPSSSHTLTPSVTPRLDSPTSPTNIHRKSIRKVSPVSLPQVPNV